MVNTLDSLVVEIFTQTTLRPQILFLLRENIVTDLMVAKRLKELEMSRKFKYFILINQNPNINTEQFFKKYNQTLGKGFPLGILNTYSDRSTLAQSPMLIKAEPNNFNYFRLVTDLTDFKVLQIDECLKKSEKSILKAFGYPKDLLDKFEGYRNRLLEYYQFTF